MRDIPSEIAEQIARRSGVSLRNLLWIKARNRETNELEEIGYWNGADVRQFVINGETRTYYGAGGLIKVGTLTSEVGLVIRKLSVNATPLSQEFTQALRGYEVKFAPVEMHLAFFSTETNQLLADPYRVFKGWIDTLPVKTPAQGGEATATINMVGNTRILTQVVASKRSNETQRLRDADDGFFKDVSITGIVQTPWGAA